MPTPDTKYRAEKLDTLYKLGAHTGHKLQNKKNVYLYQNRCPLWTQNADYEKYILVTKNGCPHRTLSMELKNVDNSVKTDAHTGHKMLSKKCHSYLKNRGPLWTQIETYL